MPPQGKLKPARDADDTTLPLAPPGGMQDLLPAHARARAYLAATVRRTFESYGYDPVVTPPFEHAEVLERGLSTVDRRDLLRFVEPESGEVALLRPDITPQVARIIATRLLHRPGPHRLCYQGTVLRRRRGRARRHQQLAQAGIELVGQASPAADAEVIEVAARACEAVGLVDYRIELGQVRVGRVALEAVPSAARARVVEALSKKDVARLETLLNQAGVSARAQKPLLRLVDAYGERDVLRRARKMFRGAEAKAALDRLERVAERLDAAGLSDRLGFDLGELRGQAYYTGVSFTVLAEGPGEPVGAGGRYDNLLARFGAPTPATGFALDLGHLAWAVTRAGRHALPERPGRFALAAEGDIAEAWGRALRESGATVARLETRERREALAFAKAWEYDAVLLAGPRGVRAERISDGAKRNLGAAAVGSEDTERLRALELWAHAVVGT